MCGQPYERVRATIVAAKYGGITARLREPAIGACLSAADLNGVHAVTWIPTVARRWRRFGIDHSQEVARHVAEWFGLPLVPLLRRVDEVQQVARSLPARRQGPRFVALPRAEFPRRVLVVDDVITTGATIRNAKSVLHATGCEWVAALVCAHSDGRKPRPNPAVYSDHIPHRR